MVDRSPLDYVCQSIVLINPLRVQRRDKKMWKLKKELACQFGWTIFTCLCHKCKAGRCQVFETIVYKHLVDYGRHTLFKVWRGDGD
jgi:hypothetical protein